MPQLIRSRTAIARNCSTNSLNGKVDNRLRTEGGRTAKSQLNAHAFMPFLVPAVFPKPHAGKDGTNTNTAFRSDLLAISLSMLS